MEQKLKVVWLCAIMNKEIRDSIGFKVPAWKRLLNYKRKYNKYNEVALWNTNAIRIFSNFDDIELHVILFGSYMLHSNEDFKHKGIHYHVLRDIDDIFFQRLNHYVQSRLVKLGLFKRESMLKYNRKRISSIIKRINPDLIHIIGAENIGYSIALLDIPKGLPVIVQLQTLLSAPNAVNNYPNITETIPYERLILKNATYIGATTPFYQEVVQKEINPKAQFLDLKLALQESCVEIPYTEKLFDFVYYSYNINKAADLAIEAFALAHERYPSITLNIVGGYDESFKTKLGHRIKELGLSESVSFEGRLPTHEDVINQIRKSKYALLPVKIDYIPGVVREAMANRLPVVTTITSGTPTLNTNRESVLLSEIGNHQAMANNMIRLLEDKDLSSRLVENSIITSNEIYDNKEDMENWRAVYHQIIKN